MRFRFRAGMRDRAFFGVADQLRVFPERARHRRGAGHDPPLPRSSFLRPRPDRLASAGRVVVAGEEAGFLIKKLQMTQSP
jgi:hypothetical protein